MNINNIKVGDNEYNLAPIIIEYDQPLDSAKVIKYSNGLMIITGKKTYQSIQIKSKWGVYYESDLMSFGAYPVPFISTPVVVANPEGERDCFIEVIKNRTATTIGEGWFASGVSDTRTVSINYIAIGKWK